MIEEGERAPQFTASYVDSEGELGTITVGGDPPETPTVVAFFPAAFSGVCTNEMAAFEDRIEAFRERDATVYGLSVDLPWALASFADEQELSFGLIGDTNRDAVEAYGLELDFDRYELSNVADRAVVVIDTDGVVRYTWRGDDPGQEPPYDEVLDACGRLAAGD